MSWYLRQHAVTWTKVDQVLWRHTASLGHNALKGVVDLPLLSWNSFGPWGQFFLFYAFVFEQPTIHCFIKQHHWEDRFCHYMISGKALIKVFVELWALNTSVVTKQKDVGISNYTHYKKKLDGITCIFPNFNGAAVEVREWKNSLNPHFSGHGIIYPCCYEN